MNCLYLTLTGGDILTRPDIMTIIEEARQNGFAIRLLTNGCLLTTKIADILSKNNPLSLEFSLYAMTPSVHDAITGVSGSHIATVNAIKMCRKRGLNTAVKMMLLRNNVNEYDNVRDFANDIGARFVFDYMLTPSDNGTDLMKEHGLTEKQIYELALKLGSNRPAPVSKPDPDASICGAGTNSLAISPTGDVFPCLAIRKSAGNLRTHTLDEIWHSPKLDKYRKMRQSDLKECATCPFYGWCSRCPGVALAETGDLSGCSTSALRAARAIKKAYGEKKHENKKR